MAVNARVDNKRGFEQMFKAFRRVVAERGVLHDLKRYEFYEKPSDKKRRKIRQTERDRRNAIDRQE